MKKIKWTKKKIIILISTIIALLAIMGGLVFCAYYFAPPAKKKIIKKVIVVQNNDNVSSEEDLSDDTDYSFSEDDYNNEFNFSEEGQNNQNENIVVKIIKKIKRIFDDDNEEEIIEYNNSKYKKQTLYIEDFDAKGDGKADDGKAIFNAMVELSNSGPGSKLIFEKNKTYYVKSATLSSVLYLTSVEGLTIDGQNSTILLDSNKEYLNIDKTKECVVKNFKFDFAKKPAFKAECVSIDTVTKTAIMKADRDIGIEEGESYIAPGGWFGALDKHDSRYHMYVSKYEMLDATERLFKIHFNTTDANTTNWLSNGMLSQNGMICPMPGLGHLVERGFSVISNTDLTLENFKIHSCARFGMFIGQNEGIMNFTDVDFVPADNDLDRDMNFTSWRDAFHVKDNRAKFNWKKCDITGNYDDAFNISSSTLYLSDYNVAKNRVTLVWNEHNNGLYYTIKPGDTLNIIDTESGEDFGTAKVKRVVQQSGGKNIVVLEEPLDLINNLGTTVLAFFTNRCAPNSTITDCNFSGTFRFRGPITISNTKIYNMRTWIDLYDDVEGPIPENITYKNCVIDSKDGDTAAMIIGANSGNVDEYGYHIKNIRFEDCKLKREAFSIYDSDSLYVAFKNCVDFKDAKIPDEN